GAVTAQRIDATWASFFGLPLPAFLLPGIQVVAHHELADYHGVWLFRHHASLCIPSRRALWRGSGPSWGGTRERTSSVKRASVLSLRLVSYKSLGRHIRATSSGGFFDLPLVPESGLWARQIRRHCGSWPTPVRAKPGSTRESPSMNRMSSAVLWMVIWQRLLAIDPPGERRPTSAS